MNKYNVISLKSILVLAIVISTSYFLKAEDNEKWNKIIGSAYSNTQSYNFLEKICLFSGGRTAGSDNNKKAIEILQNELQKIGIASKTENFTMPCWFRENDIIEMTAPVKRSLRACALGYVNQSGLIEAPVVNVVYGLPENFDTIDVKGKIVIVTKDYPPKHERPMRFEIAERAKAKGALAILYSPEKNGGIVTGGVSNFHGNDSPLPAFSVAFEDAQWLAKLSDLNSPATVKVQVKSYTKNCEVSNVVIDFPGKNSKKIVVGAHIDSWDFTNGAIDNGQGAAILFDIARLIKQYSANNYYTVELVWFNGEEFGLWGSKEYCKKHKDEIAAMINMDMPGSPTGINTMGFEGYDNFFKNIVNKLPGMNLTKGVTCNPWTNSDHMPFMLVGIPSFTTEGILDKDQYWYYHDYGDSFDKVNIRYLADASAFMSIVCTELANAENLKFERYNDTQIKELFKKYNLDSKLKHQGEWPFGD